MAELTFTSFAVWVHLKCFLVDMNAKSNLMKQETYINTIIIKEIYLKYGLNLTFS